MMKNIFRNQEGTSLVQVMVAGAMAVGIAVVVMKVSENANKSVTKMRTDVEIQEFKLNLKNMFSRPGNCTNSFANLGLDMRSPNAQTLSDPTTIPPGIDQGGTLPAYYKINNDADAIGKTFEITTNIRLFDDEGNKLIPGDPGYHETTSTYTITIDEQLAGYPNWSIKEIRLYQIAEPIGGDDSNPDTGICSMYFKAERDARVNSKRSFGAGDIIFWVNVVCSVHPVGAPDPAVAHTVSNCQENSSVLPGFWTLKTPGVPSDGIEYGYDVYVNQDVIIGRHLVVESDERVKKEIEKIPNASEKLEDINGVYYFMRAEEFPHKKYSNEKQMGVLAQEVEKVFPEAVYTTKDQLKAVRYSMLIPVLIEAHKEQNKTIRKQEKQIQNLNQKVDFLIKEIKNK